ncbi:MULTISPECIES: hypothetical protein [Sphingomonas]|uniref:hypothetical protein n=1 Tax=Sphingomonas TaxID=13687 RepID=UPI000F7DEA7F|nr:hypothetical protein [Sphingomonas sp. ABOLF]RSV14626.1 hypothetical protein CA235_11140 [Sphingomonas sp. ABOLF]GLK19226.1 hypothetical protein GCM10017606_00520 [Microbacterium terregens]
MSTLKLHTLIYSKADLEVVPEDERTFYLMATSVANDTQALNKTLAIILQTVEDEHRITNQGNSAFAFVILRMIAGRLNEAWKLVRKNRDMIASKYEAELSTNAQEGLRALIAYFDHPKPGSLIWRVRDGAAFHHDEKHVAAAFDSLEPLDDLGDYLHEKVGNTLFYTTEIIQYETLKNLAGAPNLADAIKQLINDTRDQTTNFNEFIYGFALTFAERYLPHALERLADEFDEFAVANLADLQLPYFSTLPPKLA